MNWVTESNTLKLEFKNYADLALLALSPPFLIVREPTVVRSFIEARLFRFAQKPEEQEPLCL